MQTKLIYQLNRREILHFHFIKFYIIYQKITLFFCLIFIKFISLLIYMQCIFFAIFNKLNKFNKNSEYEKELENSKAQYNILNNWLKESQEKE
jgi:hypothetical protein